MPIEADLCCILIDQECTVLLDAFHLKVPPHAASSVILTFLRFATPALRDKDNTKFCLYKPLASITREHRQLNGAQVDMRAPMPSRFTVDQLLPSVPTDDYGVDVIICVQIDDGNYFLNLLT